jgi:hypothetical protein
MEKPLPPSSLQRPQQPLPFPLPLLSQQQMEWPPIGAVQANQVGVGLPMAAIAAPTPRVASVRWTVAFSMFCAKREAVNRRAIRVPFTLSRHE